jgi:branched-chain amino acid transport system permease protein
MVGSYNLGFASMVIFGVFAFLKFTNFGMMVRAVMTNSDTVGLLGIEVEHKFTVVFGLAAILAGMAVSTVIVGALICLYCE